MAPSSRGALPAIRVPVSRNGHPGRDMRPPGGRRWRVPMAAEGWPFVLPPVGAALLLWTLGWPMVAGAALLLAAFLAFFFRDPERTMPVRPGMIVAPADGRVVLIRDDVDDAFVGPARQVSIFLSPFDVHVNRAPVDGTVVAVTHELGRFLPAWREEASERNERTSVSIEGERGRVLVRQVAGILARRIVCRVHPGDWVRAGDRFGMIKFGSRTDVVLPRGVRVSVTVGDRVRAGETLLGVLE